MIMVTFQGLKCYLWNYYHTQSLIHDVIRSITQIACWQDVISLPFVQTRTTKDFVKKLNCYLEEFRNNPSTGHLYTEKTEAHLYSGFTYDAVWTIAYALDKTQRELAESESGLTLDDIEYFEANNVSKIIGRHLAQTNFSGVSVRTTPPYYTYFCHIGHGISLVDLDIV